jgi:alkanesulfonate monooxygenase SsuD/methylene tetrahydromethanopterin reductase-like flavin-dependent oxidoreductase (luciferase family)
VLELTGQAGPDPGWLAGTVDEVAAQLATLGEAGVERVFLQHLDHRDLDAVALMGELRG